MFSKDNNDRTSQIIYTWLFEPLLHYVKTTPLQHSATCVPGTQCNMCPSNTKQHVCLQHSATCAPATECNSCACNTVQHVCLQHSATCVLQQRNICSRNKVQHMSLLHSAQCVSATQWNIVLFRVKSLSIMYYL